MFAKPSFYWFEGVKFFESGLKTFGKFMEHWTGRGQSLKKSAELARKIRNSKSPKDRSRMAQEKAKEDADRTRHEKEMDQKWPGWRKGGNWSQNGNPPGYDDDFPPVRYDGRPEIIA